MTRLDNSQTEDKKMHVAQRYRTAHITKNLDVINVSLLFVFMLGLRI